MTPIDTMYEFAGFEVSGLVWAALAGTGLPLLLGLAGMARVVHLVAHDRAPAREILTHGLFLVLAGWLLSTTDVQGVRAPRFAVFLGKAADAAQHAVLKRVNEDFLRAPFEHERVAALAGFAKILDARLRKDADLFLEACAKPALAEAEPRLANLFREGALPYPPDCEAARRGLWARIERHVDTDPVHRMSISAAARRQPSRAAEFRRGYLEQVARRAIDGPGSPTDERRLVLESLGTYALSDASQETGGGWLGAFLGLFLVELRPGSFDDLERSIVSWTAALEQGWQNSYTARQRYYLATIYGPPVYGLALLLLLALFPVAGLCSLLPGLSGVFVNFAKTFVSVKLWPLGWGILSRFNERRSILEVFEPDDRTQADVFLAVASMYLLVPGLAFLVVHLAATAAALPFRDAAPAPAGPGLGPVAPALNVVSRLSR